MRSLILTTLALIMYLAAEPAYAQNPIEYKIKASLIFNFLKFIEWPPDKISDTLLLCITGERPYADTLQQYEGEIIQGKHVEVRVLIDENPNDCHAVIFSNEGAQSTSRMLLAIGNQPILTIGESPSFTRGGGILNFEIIDETVQFQINQKTAKQNRLVISSKLLRLALRVEN